MLILMSALGEFDYFQATDFAQKLKIFMENYEGKSEDTNYCCVIHNEEAISAINLDFYDDENVWKNKINANEDGFNQFHLGLQDLLVKKNFSSNFIEFLCSCLRFDHNKRLSAQELLESPFIINKGTKGPKITLSELIKVNNHSMKEIVLPSQYQVASEKQLDKVCNALSILWSQSHLISDENNKENIKDFKRLKIESDVIQDLAFDLGLPPIKVFRKLNKLTRES